MKRFEEHKQFITTKKKLFRSSETRAGSLFMTVKNEMNRLRLKLQKIKEKKWNYLIEHGERYEDILHQYESEIQSNIEQSARTNNHSNRVQRNHR